MILGKWLAGAVVSTALLVGGGGTVEAFPEHVMPTESCFGHHVSEMARDHHGMSNATDHHNSMHGAAYSVGQHMMHMRGSCPMSSEHPMIPED